MHPIVIGIGGDDDAVVAQPIETILDVESSLQEVKFLILIDDLLALPVAVEGLPSQAEDRLILRVTTCGD